MKCACGYVYAGQFQHGMNNIKMLNHHRRACPAFWQSVYAEMKRIATMLYGTPLAISMAEWNRYRHVDFPSWEGMRNWGKSWSDIQAESGLGKSKRGRGSLAAKGKIADDAALWREMDRIAAEKPARIAVDESYLALMHDCDSYGTGRVVGRWVGGRVQRNRE